MSLKWMLAFAISPMIFLGCGGGGNSNSAPASVDPNALVTTVGGSCAAAARSQFTPAGKKIGFSAVQSGSYAYISSQSLYVAEDSTIKNSFIEGHVTEALNSSGTYDDTVDCHNNTGLSATHDYPRNLIVSFPVKIQIALNGDLTTTNARYLNVSQNNGVFNVDADGENTTSTALNADLKKADATAQAATNQTVEFWQGTDGSLSIVFHKGVQTTNSKNTQDTIVRYQRTPTP